MADNKSDNSGLTKPEQIAVAYASWQTTQKTDPSWPSTVDQAAALLRSTTQPNPPSIAQNVVNFLHENEPDIRPAKS